MRIALWKLGKYHKESDMCTVAQLVAANGNRWSTTERRVLIRDQLVEWQEVLRYFRRKKINDPIRWAMSLPPLEVLKSDVQLVGTPDENPNSPDNESLNFDETTANNHEPVHDTTIFDPDAQMGEEYELVEALLQPSNLPTTPTSPLIFHRGDKILWEMRGYCTLYLESPPANTHIEPTWHQHTTHGRFGNRFQDGIALLQRGQSGTGFESLQSAFGLIRDLVRNHHPMSLALLMAVVCELAARDMYALLRQLLIYVGEMASIDLKSTHPMAALFGTFSQQANANTTSAADIAVAISDLALLSMRASVDYLTTQLGPTDWRSLYVLERLCDCLYHAGSTTSSNGNTFYERSTLRATLLSRQEHVYGRTARNVLWTLTNVAGDFLTRGALDEAEAAFRETLVRTNAGLEGFGNAKTRFAALEGLGRVAEARAERMVGGLEGEQQGWGQEGFRMAKLREAAEFLGEAEGVASTWFEAESRRTARVRVKLARVMGEIANGGDRLMNNK